MITGDGRFDIGYCDDGCTIQESLIGGFTLSYAILSDNQANHLLVELENGVLTFIINGVPVSQLSGLSYTYGLAGLIGESAQHGGFQAVFDNVYIEEFITQ